MFYRIENFINFINYLYIVRLTNNKHKKCVKQLFYYIKATVKTFIHIIPKN